MSENIPVHRIERIYDRVPEKVLQFIYRREEIRDMEIDPSEYYPEFDGIEAEEEDEEIVK